MCLSKYRGTQSSKNIFLKVLISTFDFSWGTVHETSTPDMTICQATDTSIVEFAWL